MKTLKGKLFVAAAAICFCFISSSSTAQTAATKTVTGEVVDMACYMANGAKGEEHKSCAAGCIKGGSPMGVLTDDGQLFLLVENHDKQDAYASAKKYAGEQITVSGDFKTKGGVQSIVVNDVKGKE